MAFWPCFLVSDGPELPARYHKGTSLSHQCWISPSSSCWHIQQFPPWENCRSDGCNSEVKQKLAKKPGEEIKVYQQQRPSVMVMQKESKGWSQDVAFVFSSCYKMGEFENQIWKSRWWRTVATMSDSPKKPKLFSLGGIQRWKNSVLLAQNECIICAFIKVSCKRRTMEKRSINHFSSTHIIYFFNFDVVSPYYLHNYYFRWISMF